MVSTVGDVGGTHWFEGCGGTAGGVAATAFDALTAARSAADFAVQGAAENGAREGFKGGTAVAAAVALRPGSVPVARDGADMAKPATTITGAAAQITDRTRHRDRRSWLHEAREQVGLIRVGAAC